jgi:hypothetical protein
MKYLLAILFLFFISCKKKEGLELEIITKQLNSLNVSPDKYLDYSIKYDTVLKGATTILSYKLTNYTDKTYYFNLDSYKRDFKRLHIKVDRAYMDVTDDLNKQVLITGSIPTSAASGYPKAYLINNYLNYSPIKPNNLNNFIIHPHETLYFEWFVILPFGTIVEGHAFYVDLDAKKKYFANIFLDSDGVYYKKTLSRTDLKTIQENGYEVYNGIIKSKNKIPIIIHDPMARTCSP